MSAKEVELQEEVDRLREMVKLVDKKRKTKTAYIDFIPKGGRLSFVATVPSAVDEMDFGRYVAANLALMMQGIIKVGEVQAIAQKVPPATPCSAEGTET